jgi:hypothetical protein
LAISVLINVDSIRIARGMWEQPSIADRLKIPPEVMKKWLDDRQPAQGKTSAEVEKPALDVGAKDSGYAPNPDENAAESAINVLEENLPVGWPQGHIFEQRKKEAINKNDKKDQKKGNASQQFEGVWLDPGLLLTMTAGWLITAIATLFGAPFWYDSLQTVVRLKGTGPSSDDKRTTATPPKSA